MSTPRANRLAEWLEEHPHIETVISVLRALLPPLNYITVHYSYFITATMASSLIFWGSSTPFGSVSYIDSLFQVTSAITNTGLNTRNMSELTTWQQVQLWFLIMIGSPIWVSFWTVIIRKHAFEKHFDTIVEVERERRNKQRELRKSSSRIIRAPNLGQMISFSRHRTDPNAANPNLPGLGQSVNGDGHETAQSLSQLSDREDVVLAHGATPCSIGAEPPITNENKDKEQNEMELSRLQVPALEQENNRDHISFMELASPHTTRHSLSRTSACQQKNHLAPFPRLRCQSDAVTAASAETGDFLMHWKRILGCHNVSRNGQFYDLTSEEREHLGGCEYRALKILSLTVPFYSTFFQLIGAVALGCWIGTRKADIPESYDQNAWWSGIYASISAFNNCGFTLTDDSLISFQGDTFVLFVTGLLILAGNTAYPIFLRFGLWCTLKILLLTTSEQTMAPWKETLEFILKYPRRVYTTLFPSRATWWLFGVLIVTNAIDWLAFELLNIGNGAVEALSLGRQIMVGLFQAISVRAAGFVVISIPTLYIGLQLLYLIMMYISVYPVVITMRNSNVYEERSLGIYDDNDPAIKEQERASNSFTINLRPTEKQALRRRTTAAIGKGLRRATTFHGVGAQRIAQDGEETSRISFIGQQIRGQLAHDLWWLVLAILVIVIIETDHFLTDPITYSVFNIIFESVSAYACVGLSIGLPSDSFSFSGGLHTGSKVVMCIVMMRGRHRGLPVAIDRAVRLPGDKLQHEETEDNKIRRTKTMHRILSRDG